MKTNLEVAIIFKKKRLANGIFIYTPHHVVVGRKDETTEEFITISGKKYNYMLDLEQNYGYGLRQKIIIPKEDQKLIYQRYYEGKTQTEIAKENNISQVKVYRLERKILDNLSDKLCA